MPVKNSKNKKNLYKILSTRLQKISYKFQRTNVIMLQSEYMYLYLLYNTIMSTLHFIQI